MILLIGNRGHLPDQGKDALALPLAAFRSMII
jgi:hypothetical protein